MQTSQNGSYKSTNSDHLVHSIHHHSDFIRWFDISGHFPIFYSFEFSEKKPVMKSVPNRKFPIKRETKSDRKFDTTRAALIRLFKVELTVVFRSDPSSVFFHPPFPSHEIIIFFKDLFYFSDFQQQSGVPLKHFYYTGAFELKSWNFCVLAKEPWPQSAANVLRPCWPDAKHTGISTVMFIWLEAFVASFPVFLLAVGDVCTISCLAVAFFLIWY